MSELREITVLVPEHDLDMAQQYTGEGVTETVCAALKKLAAMQSQRRLLALRGKVEFSMSVEEMRFDR